MNPQNRTIRLIATSLVALLIGLSLLCFSEHDTSAQGGQVQVNAADPTAAEQGTINLNVKVTGKGFKNGANAKWFVTGTTNPGGVTVNSTTFVSSTELTANITVDDAATIATFDIQVLNSDGRGGKGTELFRVTAKGAGGGTCTNLALFPDNGPNAYSAFTPISTTVNTTGPCTPTSTFPGSLDSCFGLSGIAATSINPGNWAVAVTVQNDGKSVLGIKAKNPTGTGADFFLARYDVFGNLDPTFGGTGVVRFQFTSCADSEYVSSIAAQSDGKILVAGTALVKSQTWGFAVARVNSDGTLDNSFGNGGRVFFGFSQSSSTTGMALQANGKIVLVGAGAGFSVARLNANGTMDATFGIEGKVVEKTSKSGSAGDAYAVAIQQVNGEERIVVVGHRPATNNVSRDFAVMRFTSSGALDGSFGTGGKVFTDFYGYSDKAKAVNIIGDKILVGGLASRGAEILGIDSGNDFGIARYQINGQLDTAFGNGGKVSTDFSGSESEVSAMVIQLDGKIVAGGYATFAATVQDYSLARYNPDGSLDTTFGPSSNGTVLLNYSINDTGPLGLALQPDGKLIAAGGASGIGNFDYVALLRFLP
jgi:uncharacterized delta-60 repeat protein